ncbi:hypothetical protein [Proteus vulgaris]|nr:hypothetical protein [Proteus vulgaris]
MNHTQYRHNTNDQIVETQYSNKKAVSLAVLPPKVIKIITTILMAD